MVDGVPSALHKDQLNSVRIITNDSGGAAKESVYEPFGEATDWTLDPTEALKPKALSANATTPTAACSAGHWSPGPIPDPPQPQRPLL
ncbi:hypothetical protein ACMU_07145 [Actibacterium mucosum KCTC 23349]|uniref:Uncharacterized protein n=1 Tax=Actibacterium mucosum KCTC 23349 TaxID=1454373 RepID=A0A037ZM37_9RHOB|nr:hypothetical protein ACMU_07145 [Actibacterium mucosum KCTC 23349]